ncbi:LysR family transcriptional regulator [Roseibacterium sp. SDUM158017]|uniref:LysR family transcriptional regulator n=1 Tax=Roseicyclus salinarum TaxID=3036773 RepID=UPI002414EC24|nr:LysR family transcriptional regulator [Roseibacterium sp. SDUM158017]MDG4647992.1 LysR family transcriptional regulator [Roseibacterium sp. SDUM158017]
MAIKLDMLRVFRVVAERGSLSEAAKVLNRTPSAVSMMLAQLEDNVGARLFETDRKNRLTRLGELILAEAIRATDVFNNSSEAITRLAKSSGGTVRVASVPSAIATLLPPVIASFRARHADVRLEISDVDSAAVRRRIRFDEADIGILTADDEVRTDGVAIASDTLGIVFLPGGAIARRLAAARAAPSWDLLDSEPLIVNPLFGLVANAGIARLASGCNLQAANTTALLCFVRQGLGATILPESVVRTLGADLGFCRPTDPETRRNLHMICNPDRRMSPAAEIFWNAVSGLDARTGHMATPEGLEPSTC